MKKHGSLELPLRPVKGVQRGCTMRICINFFDETFTDVAAYANRNRMSLANAVRELVDLGLEIAS